MRTNIGYCNTGDWNTGNNNTGERNTGFCNDGNKNTGCSNTGDRNTGYWNIGDYNTGDWNAGELNTGDWNAGDLNTGYFNTTTPNKINVFNKECSREEWDNAKKPKFIYFNLTEWIHEEDMTEKEKEEYPTYKATGGYLKIYDYKEAFQKSFDELSAEEEEKQIKLLKALPNFDKDVFYEISGINIEDNKKELTLQEIANKFNIDVNDLRIKE